MPLPKSLKALVTVMLTALFFGCASKPEYPTLPRPAQVDLARFMGDWYVIGFIPLPPERNAHNGVESYELLPDGRIATTYHYRDGGFDGPLKTHNPVATVVPGSDNTHWGMQFIWPFKADFRIAYLAEDYSVAIIARQKRDYVWLLARSPEMSNTHYADMKRKIAEMGYSLDAFKRLPQQWPDDKALPEDG